ncbi:hypothetical protein [Microbacterium sp. Leaf159]|uniref:hypothetical protein n=1 Tax=Microbacterium sp. Leaf159 TaxID=1736279 RepID=UPI0006F54BA5|nr:hypothetical protein [Microbacterium sp. Leaf159]KQR40058.1 hypothetical protein ASF80_12095 [Microbacterium sp. Leaf159]
MSIESSPAPPWRRPRTGWLIAVAATVAVAMVVIGAMIVLGQRWWLTTNVTIALSYVGDDGHEYSCTYDYGTSDRLPMPTDIAESMNERDWSQTGQLIYDWAKTHPAESWTTEDDLPADDPRSTRADAAWNLAMERYVKFPPWLIETENGTEYELWWEVRPGSTCVDGLR